MKAVSLFRERFGGEPDGVWLAPGRANLMGEHTDYNEGFVLPFALGQGVTAAAARNPDRAGPGNRRLALCSRQQPGDAVEVDLDGLAPGRVTGWAAYPAGVAWALEAAGHRVPGACIAIDSDVPAGAGLSSSAALECATALALTSLAGLDVPRAELVTIARRAENEFAGVPTGIMDQSASLLCQAGHALLLDCRTLETFQVPFDPGAGGAGLLLINTRARHELADGEYGRRRAECEEAARHRGHQREHGAAEPPADHPRPGGSRPHGGLHRRVGLRPGHLEVVAQRGVRLRQQAPDLPVRIRRRPMRRPSRRLRRRAQQRDDLQHTLIVREHVADAPPLTPWSALSRHPCHICT